LTADDRQFASTCSAETSPGALVEAGLNTVVKGKKGGKSISAVPHKTTTADEFFGPAGRTETGHCLDFLILKLVCAANLPLRIVDYQEWKDVFRFLTPSYTPASRTKLLDDHIMGEQERVRKLQFEYLQNETHISFLYDGGSTRGGDSFYTVHATTQSRRVMLLEGWECMSESHTGEWIANMVLRVCCLTFRATCEYLIIFPQIIDQIGHKRFCCVSSDNTGNMRVSRDILCDVIRTMLNLPDPNHHMSNTIKDIVVLAYFAEVST
jgi:hypothetical protein